MNICNKPDTDTRNMLTGGVIIVDKPAGITSTEVVRRIKRLPGIKKAGHAGTLDPFATGVLVCPVNQGTRLSRFFLHGKKKYHATLRLGKATDTQDHTGNTVAEKPAENIPETAVYAIFSQFLGSIEQVPPAYSALKHNGVPLYRHARNGVFIRKPARTVHVADIEIRNIDIPDIDFEIQCSAGTYIRTICADIGEKLGCGGHLRKLDRIESSGFDRNEAVSLARLEQLESTVQLENVMVPMAEALKDMPFCIAGSGMQEKIRHGRPLSANDFAGCDIKKQPQGCLKITTPDKRLLAVIYIHNNKFDYKYCCVFPNN